MNSCAIFITAYAIRECLPKGEWYSRPNTNKTWTNYTACSMNVTFPKVSKVLQEHLPRIVMMSNIGFGISLGSLFIACLIMIGFRKLRCRRNTIHVNLFLSFILRALMNLTKVNMVKPWDCHLFFTVFMYSVLTNFVWVFIEGIYLHILIYFSVFAENPKTKWYIISGWVFPLFFVTPWVIMRIQEDNKHCWNIYRDRNIFWIIRAPILISVALNFCLFLNIVRVLFTKLNSQQNMESRNTRYRRLAKSISILIPLFTVHFIFIFLPDDLPELTEIILLYFEMFLSSFQGFVVTILLCFVNYEVKTEIARFWKRLTMDHNTSQLVLPFTSLSEYFAKTRHSISEHKMANVEDSHRKLDQACKQKLKDGIKDQTNKQSLLSEDMPLNGTNGISKIQADEETRFPLSDLSLNSKGI